MTATLVQRRIAIVLHENSFFIRSVLRGVASYARPARPWLLERLPPDGLRGKRGAGLAGCDGVITHVHRPSAVAALRSLNCPVVGVSSLIDPDPFPRITCDDHAVGRVAAEHLLGAGHRSFACVGLARQVFADHRAGAFARAIESAGHVVSRRDVPAVWLQRSPGGGTPGLPGLMQWLTELPQPTALFAANDAVAWFVSELCRRAGLQVPLHIAILGVDNDDLLCRLAYPPLSSVRLPAERIGHLAAQRLDEAITTGRPVADARLPPIGVVTRQSSDFFAVDDPDLAAALAIIREHATSGLTVAELLRQVPVSRSVFERRFRRVLGCTPLEQIHRTRVRAAQQVLADTTLPIEQVARQCGFGRANYMSRLLVRYTGRTPSQVRADAAT
jgi:LacI family transcriptional regulator